MAPLDDRQSTITMDFPSMGEMEDLPHVFPRSSPSITFDRPPKQGIRAIQPVRQASAAVQQKMLDGLYVLDWFAALTLFILTLPILLFSLLWVLIVDRGNPVFTQIRIGLNAKPYRIFKIRTMSHDHHGHARFCAHGDERIILGGKFLRRTRIDELPQLVNVLSGQMALVGPRPEQPVFVDSFTRLIPRYCERFKVKPGITGLAQITQGYVDSIRGTRKKLEFDLIFIKRRSFALWFSIVLGTVRVVILGHGAR